MCGTRTWLAAAAVLLVSASAARAQSITNLPAPRTVPLTPRVVGLSPRVASLTPRVISVAPKHTAPNTFKVSADVLFAFDRATLSRNAQAVLAQVVDQLRRRHSANVSILGYTDSVGKVKYNLGLSARRAAAVQAFLQAKAPGLTYHSRGLGEANPVAPNTLPNGQDNPDGRRQNRRVVISYS